MVAIAILIHLGYCLLLPHPCGGYSTCKSAYCKLLQPIQMMQCCVISGLGMVQKSVAKKSRHLLTPDYFARVLLKGGLPRKIRSLVWESVLLTLSLLWLFPPLLFHLSIVSEVWLLNFLRLFDIYLKYHLQSWYAYCDRTSSDAANQYMLNASNAHGKKKQWTATSKSQNQNRTELERQKSKRERGYWYLLILLRQMQNGWIGRTPERSNTKKRWQTCPTKAATEAKFTFEMIKPKHPFAKTARW